MVKIIIGVVIAALLVAVVATGFMLWNGFGSNSGSGNTITASLPSESSEVENTPPVTEKIEYVEVSISGNEYIFQNSTIQLEELIEKLINQPNPLTVKITDDYASQKAYDDLTKALSNCGIRYIETSNS